MLAMPLRVPDGMRRAAYVLALAACVGSPPPAGAIRAPASPDACAASNARAREVSALLSEGRLLCAVRVFDRADRECPGHPMTDAALRDARAKLQEPGNADMMLQAATSAYARGDLRAARELFDRTAWQMQQAGAAPELDLPEDFAPSSQSVFWKEAVFLPDGVRVATLAGSAVALMDSRTGARELLRGAPEALLTFTVSHDGRFLAAASEHHVVLWETTHGERVAVIAAEAPLYSLQGEGPAPRPIAFAPGDQTVAFGDDDDLVLWDVTHETVRAVVPHAKPTGLAPSVSFLDHGSLVLVAHGTDGINVIDVTTGAIVATFPRGVEFNGRPDYAISPDGSLVAIKRGSGDMQKGATRWWIDLWDASRRRAAGRMPYGRCGWGYQGGFAFSPDGAKLLTGSVSEPSVTSVCVFDVARRALSNVLPVRRYSPPRMPDTNEGTIDELIPTRDGGSVVVGLQGGSRFVELTTGRAFPRPITFIGALADGSIVARNHDESRLMRIAPDMTEVPLGDLDTSWAYVLESAKNELLVTLSKTGRPPSVRDPGTNQVLYTLEACEAEGRPAVASPDGSLLVEPGRAGRPCVWRADNGKLVAATPPPLPTYAPLPVALAFSPGGLLVSLADGSIRLYDGKTGAPHRLIPSTPGVQPFGFVALPGGMIREPAVVRNPAPDGFGGTVLDSSGPSLSVRIQGSRSLTLSSDGAWLVASQPGETSVLDGITGAKLRVLAANQVGDARVAIQPAGSTLALPDAGHVGLWDLERGLSLGNLDCAKPGEFVRGIAFDASGKRVAAACSGGGVYVWDVASHERLGVLGSVSAFDQEYWGPVFGGPWLAAAGPHGKVEIWDAPSQASTVKPGETRSTPRLSISKEDVRAVAFSPDARLLAIATYPAAIALYAMPEGRALLTLELRGGPSGDAVTLFAPDGTKEITDARDVLALSRCVYAGRAAPFELCEDLWLVRGLWARQLGTTNP
jgi:WD40 repeat protein